MAFRVVDAQQAYERAIALGAEPADRGQGALAMDVPAIMGIGSTLLYFLDTYGAERSVFDAESSRSASATRIPPAKGCSTSTTSPTTWAVAA